MIKTVLLFFAVIATATVYAQYDSKIYNQYLDFNKAELENRPAKMVLLIDSILKSSEKLPLKSQTHFYRSLGKFYEQQHQPEKSIYYNEQVVKAVPGFYTAHRALGYLYILPLDDLVKKINQSRNNRSAHDKFQSAYFSAIKTALPHLEKAEACDHDEQTLALIKSLYEKLNDKAGLASLDKRLNALKQNCVELLTD